MNEKRTHAQYRTLDDLENDGIQVYLDKGGTLIHSKQPRMDCYGVRVVRVERVAALEAELEAWTEKGALFVEQGDRLSEMEDAARPFVIMRFEDGIAGHDDDGHPLSHEGMARKRLREALAGETK